MGPWWVWLFYVPCVFLIGQFWINEWRDRREHRRARRGHHHPPAEGITLPSGPIRISGHITGPGAGLAFGSGAHITARALDPARVNTPLPTRTQEDAIRAWKRAHVHMTPRGWRFVGIGRGVEYEADQLAYCADSGYVIAHTPGAPFGIPHTVQYETHEAPQVGCGCGFYAHADRHDADGNGQGPFRLPVLEVDLSGRVIRCTNGYRAQHQRVLAVHWPKICRLCMAPADTLVLPGAYAQSDENQSFVTAPRCAEHVGRDDVVITFDQLTAGLGTENRWLDPDG